MKSALSALTIALASAGVTTTAFAQIQTLDVQMRSSNDFAEIILEPLTFAQPGEIDPRRKIARKPFIGTLIFERDQVVKVLEDGSQVIDTTTSSCAITAAYDPEALLAGRYDVEGYSADHCVTRESEITFDRAIALFPGAGKTYHLTPAHFKPSGETSAAKVEYGFDWAKVSLPEDPELAAVPLHIGDYEGPVVFEASTKGYRISPETGKKVTHYVATYQECYIARRYRDLSSDKVSTCRTAKAMSGGGFFIPETGALYATLSRIGEETLYSYATLVSAVGTVHDPDYELSFHLANYSLRGVDPFGAYTKDEVYQVAQAPEASSCRASDGTNLVDKLMLAGVSYREAKQLC